MRAIITYPEKKEHTQALKAFLTALSIRFEYKSDSSLTVKIKEARQEKSNGELKQIDPKNVWKNIL